MSGLPGSPATSGFSLVPAGWVIPSVLLVTLFLQLRRAADGHLVPFAPYIALLFQLGSMLLALPGLRLVRGRVSHPVLLMIGLWASLFALALLSGIWSDLPGLVIRRTLLVLVPVILLGLVALADRDPLRTFIRVARALVYFGSALAFVGLLIYGLGEVVDSGKTRVQTLTVGPIQLSQELVGVPPLFRISSLTGNPNSLASLIMLTLPMSLFLLQTSTVSVIRGALIMLIQVAALVMTFSRAGIAATFIAVLAFYFFSAPTTTVKMKKIAVLFLLCGLIFLIISVAAPGVIGSERFSGDLNRRGEIWKPLVDRIVTRPLLGVGFGVSYETLLVPLGHKLGAHSAHLQTLAEMGGPGYLMFLALWIFPFLAGSRTLRSGGLPDSARSMMSTALAMIVELFFHQAFESSLLRYGFHTLFWSYLGFVLVHPSWFTKDAVAVLRKTKGMTPRESERGYHSLQR